jgi:lysophospholipase L1-like esterase
MNRQVYLALGDSITAGYGSTHPTMAFVHHVSSYIHKRGLAERTFVVAKNGWTSGDLVRAAGAFPESLWAATNVITLLSGGNDLRQLLRRQYLSISRSAITPQLVEERVQKFARNLDGLCSLIHRHGVPHVVLATVYNPVPNFPTAVTGIVRLNEVIRTHASRFGFGLVDVHAAFENKEANLVEGYRTGRLDDLGNLFRRPIHPNNAGHRTIANLFRADFEAGTAPLTRKTRRTQSKHN